MSGHEARSAAHTSEPIPGPDPGACPKCGQWRKAGMLHDCPGESAASPSLRERVLEVAAMPSNSAG